MVRVRRCKGGHRQVDGVEGVGLGLKGMKRVEAARVVACGWCSVVAMLPFWQGLLEAELSAARYEHFALDTILVAKQRAEAWLAKGREFDHVLREHMVRMRYLPISPLYLPYISLREHMVLMKLTLPS